MAISALIVVALCVVVPVAIYHAPEGDSYKYMTESPALIVMASTTAVLLIVTIFLYKNLPMQMRVTWLCILLMLVLLALTAFVFTARMQSCEVLWITAVSCVGASIILAIWAFVRMKHDQRILRSYDRLR